MQRNLAFIKFPELLPEKLVVFEDQGLKFVGFTVAKKKRGKPIFKKTAHVFDFNM